MIPAFRNWSTSPEPGWTTTATVSATSATSVSDWPDADRLDHDHVERGGQGAGGGARRRGEAAEPVAGRGRADEHSRGRPGRTSIRARSPSSAPPERREVGSTASTATDRPRARHSATSRESSEDLPTPGGPVMPTMWAGASAAERGGGDRGQQRLGLRPR